MTTPADRRYTLAAELVVLKAIGDKIDKARTQLKNEATGLYAHGEGVPANLPDGTNVGKVTKPKAAATANVADPDKLLEWARANRPGEIVREFRPDPATLDWLASIHPEFVVETIRPAYTKTLCDQAKNNGAAFDLDTGEQIPGVEVSTGTPPT